MEEDKMAEDVQLQKHEQGRRDFLSRCLGGAIACGAVAATAGSVIPEATAAIPEASGGAAPAIPGYDWNKHHWAFGVDATKCIGCLRCVEACKKENNVNGDAHHFRT